jgi:ribosomal protein S19E (S16A)
MASSGVLAHRLRLLRIIAAREKRAKEHDPPLPAPQQEWFNEQQRRTLRQAKELGLVADTDGVRLTGAGKRFLDIFGTKRRRKTPTPVA